MATTKTKSFNSSNVIGFYLQLEDELSPVLAQVDKAYSRLSKNIDKTSRKIEARVKKTFQSIGRLAGQLDRMAAFSSSGTLGGDKRRKSIIELALEPKVPTRKQPGKFDTRDVNRRYRSELQPPSYRGFLKFAKGGIVPGNGNTDSVPSLLTPGELVVPKDTTKSLLGGLSRVKKSISGLVTGFKDFLKSAKSSGDGTDNLGKRFARASKSAAQMAASVGLAEKALDGLQSSVAVADDSLSEFDGIIQRSSRSGLDLIDVIKQANPVIMGFAGAAVYAGSEWQWLMHQVQSSYAGTEAAIDSFKKSAWESMAEIGTSFDETADILRSAALFKIPAKDAKSFIKTSGMTVQALEAVGVSAKDTTDLLRFGLQRAGVEMTKTPRVIGGLIKVSKVGAVSFNELADAVKRNTDLFNYVGNRGGNVEKAIQGVAGAVGYMQSIFLDSKPTEDFFNNLTNRSSMLDRQFAMTAATIHAATGLTVQDMQRMNKEGKQFDLLKIRIQSMQYAWENADDIIREDAGLFASRFGFARAEVEQFIGTMKKGGMTIDEFTAKLEKEGKFEDELQKQWEAFNSTLKGLTTRIRQTLLPVLIQVGIVLVEMLTYALKPVFWIVTGLATAFNALPQPVKYLMAAVVALTAATAAYNTVAAITGRLMGLVTKATLPQMAKMLWQVSFGWVGMAGNMAKSILGVFPKAIMAVVSMTGSLWGMAAASAAAGGRGLASLGKGMVGIIPRFGKVGAAATAMTGTIGKAFKWLGRLILPFAIWIVGFFKMSLLPALAFVGKAFAAVGAAIAGVFTGPVLIAIAAIAALVGGFIAFIKWGKQIGAFFDSISNYLLNWEEGLRKSESGFSRFVADILSGIRYVTSWLGGFFKEVGSYWDYFVELFMATGVSDSIAYLKDAFFMLKESILGLFGPVNKSNDVVKDFGFTFGWVKTTVEVLAQTLGVLVSVLTWVVTVVVGVSSVLIDYIVKPILKILIPVFKFLWAVVKGVFGAIWAIVEGVGKVIYHFVAGIISLFTGDWAGLWEHVKSGFVAVWDMVVGVLGSVADIFVSFFVNLGATVGAFFEGTWSGLTALIAAPFEAAAELIGGVFRSVFDWLSEKLSAVGNWIKDSWIGKAWGWLTGSGKDADPAAKQPAAVKMASGGIVKGHGNMDTVPALLTPGEMVIPKEKTKQIIEELTPSKKYASVDPNWDMPKLIAEAAAPEVTVNVDTRSDEIIGLLKVIAERLKPQPAPLPGNKRDNTPPASFLVASRFAMP